MTRTTTGRPWRTLLEDVWRDCRYAARGLWRTPAFTLVAVLTLALGIGAVTVIYSVVHNVAVAPLPYRDADRLVNVFVEDTRTQRVRGSFSPAELASFRDQSSVFEGVIGTAGQGMLYQTAERAEYLRAVWVTPNFFEFMGLRPLLGRAIVPDDGRPGTPPVTVLRHRAWTTSFAADPSVIGTTVLLNGEPRTIVGVMPPRFTWHGADLWLPGPIDPDAAGAGPPTRNFQARLKRGVTEQQAEAELALIVDRRAREHPADYPEQRRVRVLNVIAYTVGGFSGVLYTVLAAVGLLLLIACCNVANMLLARATTRQREMTIRTSLGAGRARIVRQLMIESVLLASVGAAFGCLFAYLGIDALVARLPQNPLPGEVDITLNAPVLLFSLGAAGLSAVLFGMAPALYTVRRDLASGGLKAGGRGMAGGRSRLGHGLVIAEVALSLVLVLSAGLLMRSFVSMSRVDLGFSPDNLLVAGIVFPPARYTTAPEKQRFYQESHDRLASLPGVEVVAATTRLPPFDAAADVAVELTGAPAAGTSSAVTQPVTADYFRTLGIRFARGGGFRDLAVGEPPRFAVVNQAFAVEFAGRQDPVGRQIRLTPLAGPSDPTRHGVFEITGVVDDVKNQGLRDRPEPQVYLPWSSGARGFPTMLVRTAGDPIQSIAAVRRELSLVDRQVAVLQLRTLPEILDRSFYAQTRFSLLVLGIFAATGTLLVAIGVFSVMAYTVSRQKKEIAVRMALGASRAHVYGVTLRLGAQLLAAGTAVGLLASFATNRLLVTQLWNVSPHDPLTLVGATVLVSLIALTACYVPARRATRVEPIAALRDD